MAFYCPIIPRGFHYVMNLKNSPHWGVSDAVWRGGFSSKGGRSYRFDWWLRLMNSFRISRMEGIDISHWTHNSINVSSLRDKILFGIDFYYHIISAGLNQTMRCVFFRLPCRGIGMGQKKQWYQNQKRKSTSDLPVLSKFCSFERSKDRFSQNEGYNSL